MFDSVGGGDKFYLQLILSFTILIMLKASQKQQMNVPIHTRNNQEVQTDVNLIGFQEDQQLAMQLPHPDSQFLDFVSESWMSPFSDYYLLSQLNNVIQQLKNNLGNGEEFRTRKIVDELATKIHGLLARELKLTGKNTGYYDILLEKQKQITKLEIKYGNFDKKLHTYNKKIQELERQIQSLRGTLKIYQTASQQNQIYKGFFKEIKELTANSKKITDIDKLLTQQVLSKIREFEVNLAQISKNAGRERASKQKAAISRYALELDDLSRSKQLDWATLSNSAAAFFTSLEHLNNDDWVQQRLNLTGAYNELRARHVAVISLVSKNIQQLLKKDVNFRNFAQVSQLIRTLEQQNQQGYETMIVNGWIGLGATHTHSHLFYQDQQQLEKLNAFIALFQSELKNLIEKYPQLSQTLSSELRQFLSLEVIKQVGGDALSWIKQILVRQTEVVHVDNVYNYYSKTDKQSLYYLRILVKVLLDELKRITNDHKIGIELDQGILELLKNQVLEGVNVEDVIALFRPTARICELPVILEKPNYIINTQTVGVPLKQQNAVIVANKTHFAVNLQQGVPYRKQIPYEYSKTQVVEVPVLIEKPYPVPTKVVEEVIKFEQKVNVVKVPVDQQKFIQVIQQNVIGVRQQMLAAEAVYKQVKVPYHTTQVVTSEVSVEKQIPKNVYKELNKIFKVEQTVPKVYKEPKFEIVEKPVHHVILQKEIEFVEVQKPIIERLEVAKVTEILVEKPIYYPQHCDCQKPEAVIVQVEKPVYKEVPKEIIIEKCHFVQPNVQEKIVQVACHTQVPVYKQIVKQEPIFIEKIVPFRTLEEKLIIIDRQIPFFIQHFTPVELIVEKPVIVRDIKHVPVQVEQPVPIYIQKVIPKVVEVFRDKIVQKIVEIPRVQIIEKIVQKIVPIPRIVEKIVTVPQLVQVPIFIETPILEVVEIPVQRLVTDIQEREKIVEVKTEILKIQKIMEVVEKIQYEQVKKIVEVQPEVYPQIVVQKIVKVVEEKPIQVYIDRLVDRVIQIKEIIPVEQRVQIPIQVPMPVEIITNKPIFYKQPIVQIDIQRVQREKLVEVEKQTIQIHQIPAPCIQKQKEIVYLPGQTIILKEPELHIIQVEKQNIITTRDVEERPVQHYLDLHKAHVVDQQTYVVPEKGVLYLQKPYAVAVEKPIKMRHEEMVVVERPETVVVKTREGRNEQVVKVITQEKLVAQKQSYPQPILVPEHHYHVVYEELPPKQFEKSVIAIDEKVKTQQITNTIEMEGSSQKIITKEIQVPIYMQKIVQKILMLPQIVEVEKKVYMIEEINSLIAKQVNIETHYNEYRDIVKTIQDEINQLIVLINSGRKIETSQLNKKLQLLLQLFKTESRIPKIVQNVRQVEVVKERDRPVLVPVYDSEREKTLHLIISELIDGIKGLSKAELQKRFSERIRNLLSTELALDERISGEGTTNVQQAHKIDVQSKWKSWLDNYDKQLPSTRPTEDLTQAEQLFIVGYDPKGMDSAALRASLQKLTLVHKQRLYEIEKLKSDYSKLMDQLKLRVDSLETLVATEKYYKDLYLTELIKLKVMLERGQQESVKQALQIITSLQQEIISNRVKVEDQIAKPAGEANRNVQSSQVSNLVSQLTKYEEQIHSIRKQLQRVNQENERLTREIDDIQLNIPIWNKQSSDEQFREYNEEWEEKVKDLEQNHFIEINHLREQLMRRLADGSTEGADQFNKTYDELFKKYTVLSETQRNYENDKRNLINSYEERLRDLNKQLLAMKRDNEVERKRLIDDYEKRLASTPSNQEKQLHKQLEQLSRNYENAQADKKKLIDDYEFKLKSGTQAEQALKNFEYEKKKLIQQYENKLKQSGSTQQKQLREELDTIKRNFEKFQKNVDLDRKSIIDEYEKIIKELKDEPSRAKMSKRSDIGSSPEQAEQYQILKQKIKDLENQLQISRRQVQSYQKLKLGQTSYTSGLKRSGFEGEEFQSPQQARYKLSGSRFQLSNERKQQQPYSSEVQSRRFSRSGMRTERKRIQQSEQIRSQSSRVSAGSESSYKTSMTLRQLIELKNIDDKDQIITAVMFKVLEQIEKEAQKGIINCYTPNNINLRNFNPNNIDSLIIKFGVPITNKNNKDNGLLYLAPEVLRGQGISLKSVVFSLGVIWDELIHSQIFFKTAADIQNLAYEYNIRDNSLNPVLKNTLIQMMSKDPKHRIELSEAKNRLSLERFIVNQVKGGNPGARISSQRKS